MSSVGYFNHVSISICDTQNFFIIIFKLKRISQIVSCCHEENAITYKKILISKIVQSAGAVEYTECTTAEG